MVADTVIKPVSYTHLDVYKRQVMGTMDTSFVTGGVPVHAPNINVPANIQAVINCLCVHLVIG